MKLLELRELNLFYHLEPLDFWARIILLIKLMDNQTRQIEAFQTIAIPARNRGWLLVWAVVLFLGALAYLAYPVIRLGYFYQINYSEGLNAYHQKEAVDGQPLYSTSQADPFTPTTIPPLSLYAIGLAGKIAGDYLIPGRVVSMLALGGIALFTGLLLLNRGTRKRAALFGSLSSIILLADYAPEYIGMNDPHILALAITLTGLLVYAYKGETTAGLILSALITSIGLCTSQTAFPAILAIGLDVFIHSRRRGILWLGSAIVTFLLVDGLAGFHSGALFLGQFTQITSFSFDTFSAQLNRLDLLFLILLLVTGWAAIICLFAPRLRLKSFYFFFSFIFGFTFTGGSTSGIFHLFDLFAAMGLLIGLSVNRVPVIFHRVPALSFTATWILPPILVFCLLFNLPDRLPKANTLNLLASTQTNFERDVVDIRNQPGRVFCENLLLCFYAGKPLEMDSTTAAELAIQGESDENLLLAVFESRQFDLIQLNRTIPKDLAAAEYTPGAVRMGSMTRNMRVAILKNYRFDHRGGTGVFYVPVR